MPGVDGGLAVVMARVDLSLVTAWLVLVVVGIVMVSSATASQPEGSGYYLAKHLVYVLGAVIVLASLACVPLRVWEIAHVPCLVLGIVFCALVLVPGVSQEINGSRRWVELGLIRFQPGEAAKFLLVVYLAGCVARAGDALSTHWQLLLKPVGLVVVVLVLILYQPDFGSVVLLALLTGGILFIGGARLRDFLLLAVLGGVAMAAVAVVEPYRVERLMTFTDPWATPYGTGYQLTQALIAFGSGGFFGLGIGEGGSETALSALSPQRLHLCRDCRGTRHGRCGGGTCPARRVDRADLSDWAARGRRTPGLCRHGRIRRRTATRDANGIQRRGEYRRAADGRG